MTRPASQGAAAAGGLRGVGARSRAESSRKGRVWSGGQLLCFPRRIFLWLLVIGLLAPALLGVPPAAAAEPDVPANGSAPPAAPAAAAPPLLVFPEELGQTVARISAAIETTAKAVERVRDRQSDLAAQRLEIERIEIEAQSVIAALTPRLADVQAQIEKLGPPPKKEDQPEAPALAQERTRLAAVQTQIAGAMKTAELTSIRARQLIGHVQELRQAIFARELLQRSTAPLSLATLRQLSSELPRAGRQIRNIALDWWQLASHQLMALIALAVAAGLTHAAVTWGLARAQALRPPAAGPDLLGVLPRVLATAWTALTLAAPGAAAALVAYGGLVALDLLTFSVERFLDAALRGYLLYLAVASLAAGLLAPCPPQLRLVDLTPATAARLVCLARALAAVLALDLVLSDVISILFLPLEIGVVETAATSLAFAALLLAFVRTPLAREEGAEEGASAELHLPAWLKVPFAALALAIVATTLSGYVALGRFIAIQTMLVGGAAFLILLANLLARGVAAGLSDTSRPVGHMLETRLGIDRDRTSQLSRLVVLLFDLGLILVAVPLILLTWGFSKDDIFDWLKLGVFGFEIGQFRISLARILLASLLFLGLVSATRLIQRWLEGSVLRPARVDGAITHSVLMGVRYAGIGLAALAALSYAGLDFTQLAIVAGALSLGVGFGLQAVVSNFVSGLILLIERPVKVGDWIVVNGQEGLVRRINVRATEIETFDKASLIVPNSELITRSVTNWTHRNSVGRLIIHIGVSYKADPEQVIGILRRIADQSSSLLRQPAPMVAFEDFGDSALKFSLRAFVADVGNRLAVQTELRLAISRQLKEAGIEIPYPQHDIHLRDLDGPRQALAMALERRRREQEMEAAAP